MRGNTSLPLTSHPTTLPINLLEDNISDQPLYRTNNKPQRTNPYFQPISPFDDDYFTFSVNKLPRNVKLVFYNTYFLLRKYYDGIDSRLLATIIMDIISRIIRNKGGKKYLTRDPLLTGVIIAYIIIITRMNKYIPLEELVASELGSDFARDREKKSKIMSEFFRISSYLHPKMKWRDLVDFYLKIIVFGNNLPVEIYSKSIEILRKLVTNAQKGKPSRFAYALVYCASKKLNIKLSIEDLAKTSLHPNVNIIRKHVRWLREIGLCG